MLLSRLFVVGFLVMVLCCSASHADKQLPLKKKSKRLKKVTAEGGPSRRQEVEIGTSGTENPIRGKENAGKKKKSKKKKTGEQAVSAIAAETTMSIMSPVRHIVSEALHPDIYSMLTKSFQCAIASRIPGHLVPQMDQHIENNMLPLLSGVRIVDKVTALGISLMVDGKINDAVVIFYHLLKPFLKHWIISDEMTDHCDRQCGGRVAVAIEAIEAVVGSAVSANDNLHQCFAKFDKELPANHKTRPGFVPVHEIVNWNNAFKSPCGESCLPHNATKAGLSGALFGIITGIVSMDFSGDISIFNSAVLSLMGILLDDITNIPESGAAKVALAEAHEQRAKILIESTDPPTIGVILSDLYMAEVLYAGAYDTVQTIADENKILNVRFQRAQVLLRAGRHVTALRVLESVAAFRSVVNDATVQAQLRDQIVKCHLEAKNPEEALPLIGNMKTARNDEELIDLAQMLHEAGLVADAALVLEGVIVTCSLHKEESNPTRVMEELDNLKNPKAGAVNIAVFYHSIHNCAHQQSSLHRSHMLLAQWMQEIGETSRAYVHAIAAYMLRKQMDSSTDMYSLLLAEESLVEMGEYEAAQAISRHLLFVNVIPQLRTHILAREAAGEYMAVTSGHVLSHHSEMDVDIYPAAVQISLLELWFQYNDIESVLDKATDAAILSEQFKDKMISAVEIEFNFKYRTIMYTKPRCAQMKNNSMFERSRDILLGTRAVANLVQRSVHMGFPLNGRKHIAFQLGVVDMAQRLVEDIYMDNDDTGALSWKQWAHYGVVWRQQAQPSDQVAWATDFPESYRMHLNGFSTSLFNAGVYNRKYSAYVISAVQQILSGLVHDSSSGRVGGDLYMAKQFTATDAAAADVSGDRIVPNRQQRKLIFDYLSEVAKYKDINDRNAQDMAVELLFDAITMLRPNESLTGARFLFSMDATLTISGRPEKEMGFIHEITILPEELSSHNKMKYIRKQERYQSLADKADIGPPVDPLDRVKLSLVAPMRATRDSVLQAHLADLFSELRRSIKIFRDASMDGDATSILDKALDFGFYWILLNPLNRGSAMLGYEVVVSHLLAAGITVRPLNATDDSEGNLIQMDLEAVLSSDVNIFRKKMKETTFKSITILPKSFDNIRIPLESLASREWSDACLPDGRDISLEFVGKIGIYYCVGDLIRTKADIVDILNCDFPFYS